MSDSQNGGGEVSLTIKHDGKYEAPWTVFRGTPSQLKSLMIEFYGLDEKGTGAYDDKSASDVFYEAVKQADAEYAATKQLGGRVVRKNSSKAATPEAAAGTDSPPWNEEADAKPNPILALIEGVQTVADLQRLWAENQAEFKDEAVMSAYKARGQALSN